MALDLTLGVIVLLAALRGWLKGFLIQAIHLGALVGSVYLADPLCNLARPHAHAYFPAIREGLLDRLLWWTAVVLSYLLASGIPSTIVKLVRKRAEFVEPEFRWGDRGAGFLLGVVRGALIAAFLLWGISAIAPRYAQSGGWIAEQVQSSRALPLNTEHRPAERIWYSPPVQVFVQRVKSRGFGTVVTPSHEASPASEPLSARRLTENVPASLPPPSLSMPKPFPSNPKAPDFLDTFDRELLREGLRTAP